MSETFTRERQQQAEHLLDRYSEELHREGGCNVLALEMDLRSTWGVGYQALKSIIIDMMRADSPYRPLAGYYAEFSNRMMMRGTSEPFYAMDPGKMCVISEFKQPLAELYGASSWHNDGSLSLKRQAFWKAALPLELQSPV